VYTNKKSLKGDQDGVFITENLTKYRTELVKRLSQLKFHRQIYTYWTSDGRIYVKKLETSRKQLVTNFVDIENIECSVYEQTASQTSNKDTILVTFEGFLVGVHTVSGPIRQKSHNDLCFSLVYFAYHMGSAYVSFDDV
jgi:hypothetical protein